MNRTLLIAGSLLTSGLAYAAGRMLVDPAVAPDGVPGAAAPKAPRLGDPRVMAQTARERLEKVPPTLWAAVPLGESAQVDGLALSADLSAMPVVAADALPSAPPPPRIDPGPTPGEIAGQLARSIAAVKRSDGVASLVVIDSATGVRRTLNVGDPYRDGWRVAIIAPQSVTLSRKSAKVAVPLGFGWRTASRAAPYLPSPVNAAGAAANRPGDSATPPNSARPRRRIARPGTSGQQEL